MSKVDMTTKVIKAKLNGKEVAIEIIDELGLFPDAKVLPVYSKPIKDTKCFFCDTLCTKRGINVHISKFHRTELSYNRKNNLPLPEGY